MRTITLLRIACAIAVLSTGMRTTAQTINSYRYWFDDDPATMVTNSVAGVQTLSLNTTLNASSLGKGFHRATMQFKDSNNAWGAPTTSVFYHNGGNLTAYQYWFDDMGVPMSVNLTPGPTADITASLNASGLDPGYHRITFRTRDVLGNWSAPETAPFTRMGGNEVAWQYWLDDDVTTFVETTVASTALVNVISQIDLSALPTGPHTITLRTRDELDGYSVPLTQAFDVVTGIAELPGVLSLALMPNPVEDMLVLRIDANSDQSLRVEVIDALGRTVMLPVQCTFSGTLVRDMDVSGLARGSYQLRMTGATGGTSLPFIKR